MYDNVNKLFQIVKNYRLLKQLLSMNSSGYLKDIGWINSFNKKIPVDYNLNPLPWVTYGFMDFISERLHKELDIFEYGSGNSTLWYAARVKSVTSVEHDAIWFNKIKNKMPSNVNITYKKLIYDGEYSKFPNILDKKFDIIIVDGRDRVNCMKNTIDSIKENGVIVLDDSEREPYEEGMMFLGNKGFKRIDFWGISPGLFYKKNTTLFYKNDNCLGI